MTVTAASHDWSCD